MVYKLNKEKSLIKNISSIANEEIEASLEALETLNIHEAIHDIRKRLKKLRALCRLVRDEMGEDNYKSINIYFRDLGKEISDFRDLTAHLETLEMLNERFGKYLYVNFFRTFSKQIEEEREQMENNLRSQNFFSEHLVKKLKKAKQELTSWPVESNNIDIILPSIERVYKRGQMALQKAYETPEKENFHEWRKRVKYLWYQTLLLQDTWPNFFDTLEAEIHELADLLGNDHDLMVLKEKILAGDFSLKEETHRELMIAIINEYSNSLRSNAKTRGELIYAESPKDFKKRIGKYTEINWN
ncbi:CHAD domain-containing protein [Christiangramia sediminis]|uniref:CHAD domain-containing protein n=1 Tax=Christiangramia sediminis TaxID=2881336 RepID=A0A9X1RVH2_9FLAO|nr:CHAD domain-containing protein [Christiangramia sediminis]MCB7479722.1 CHAD domain-containing protein [Christiangramia sediminis]